MPGRASSSKRGSTSSSRSGGGRGCCVSGTKVSYSWTYQKFQSIIRIGLRSLKVTYNQLYFLSMYRSIPSPYSQLNKQQIRAFSFPLGPCLIGVRESSSLSPGMMLFSFLSDFTAVFLDERRSTEVIFRDCETNYSLLNKQICVV